MTKRASAPSAKRSSASARRASPDSSRMWPDYIVAIELNAEGGVDRIVYHELTHSLIENTRDSERRFRSRLHHRPHAAATSLRHRRTAARGPARPLSPVARRQATGGRRISKRVRHDARAVPGRVVE